ncbi:MAG TPA: DNA adenine methylase [Planctomycetota bacterium]|nr:DNA adenine methylase [Planctomycetota bacterium]
MPDSNTHLKSPLRYPGGKCRVAKLLGKFAPAHSEYREIFAGGAAFFFWKPLAERSWINDLHPGLYAFYRALRDHFEPFAQRCRAQKGDLRKLFGRWAARRDLMESQDDSDIVERAVQYYFLNRTVWSGRVVFDPRRRSRLYFSNPGGWQYLDKKLAHLQQLSLKLQGVKITCLDFAECMVDADEDTFIYADPPYIRESGCSLSDKLYDKAFTTDCHRRLADALCATSAKVMISYDDCDDVYALYRDAKWRPVPLEWKYCGRYAVTNEAKAAGEKEKKVAGKELVLLNYDPPAEALTILKRMEETSNGKNVQRRVEAAGSGCLWSPGRAPSGSRTGRQVGNGPRAAI